MNVARLHESFADVPEEQVSNHEQPEEALKHEQVTEDTDLTAVAESEGPTAEIEQAMAEAVASMEAREEGREQEIDIEVEEGDSSKKDPRDAVTEAIIKAKNELETVLKQTQEEAKALREKWMRAVADLDNYKKRTAKEKDDLRKFANEKLLADFLPVIDDIDRTNEVIESVTQGVEGGDKILDGVRLVQKKILTQLEKNGVESFSSLGETFDPNKHDAVQQIPSTEYDAGIVCAELQRGFTINGRLLRAALVTVSLGKSEDKSSDEGNGA